MGDKDQLIISSPHVLWPSTVASQPEHTLDASQIQAVRDVLIVRAWRRRDGDGARWRLVAQDGLAPIPFRLITVLQAQVGSHLKRAERKTKRCCLRIDVGACGAVRKAKLANGQFHRGYRVARFRRRELIAREEGLARRIDRDSVALQVLEQGPLSSDRPPARFC